MPNLIIQLMKRQLFIGDIHGCHRTLKRLLKKVKLEKKDHLILLGDYINRGPDSKGVLDEIMQLINAKYNVSTLRGNHEEMLLSSYRMETSYGIPEKISNELKTSFCIKSVVEIPKKYIDFCESTNYYIENKKFIAVHGGLNFEFENPLNNKHDMLWIRKWYSYINYEWLKDRIIIHGHTPQSKQKTKDQLENINKDKVLNLDCGAAFFNQPDVDMDLGSLCCFDLTNQKLYFQENCDSPLSQKQKKILKE